VDSENNESGVVVALTPDEVKFVMECLVNCPVTTSVRDMPSVIGLAQGIIKKLNPSPATPVED
jgi:mRNA-degrading endonuclease toxin of MazEF toxin-antitoxin module